MLKTNLIKYRLIEEHMRAVKCGLYGYAQLILYLLRRHKLSVGLGDDDGFSVELFAERIGCRISYNRSYTTTYIRF